MSEVTKDVENSDEEGNLIHKLSDCDELEIISIEPNYTSIDHTEFYIENEY